MVIFIYYVKIITYRGGLMDKVTISTDDDYKYCGILYEKFTLNNYNIYKPKKMVKCKAINGNAFEDELENVYFKLNSSSMDNEAEVLHFMSASSSIKKVYEERKNDLIIQHPNKNGIVKIEFVDIQDFINSSVLRDDDIDNYKVNINVKELYDELNSTIINQHNAIKDILTVLDVNYNVENYRNKTNILLIGPSGSGKTEIFRTIASKINVPITIEDSEQYSTTGYEGASVSDMLLNLYHNAHDDLKAAEHGILVIDEIDKKITSDNEDVSGKRVLNALLSIMEGTVINISVNQNFMDETIMFNTNHLTVVLVGAFSDLIKKNTSIGIDANIESSAISYGDIDERALIKYGLTPENIRRVSIFRLNTLTMDNFIEIMLKSKNSTLLEYKNYLKKKQVELNITDDALKKIATKAYKKNIGASGIKASLNEIFLDAFFDILCHPNTYDHLDIDTKSLDEVPPYRLTKKR